MSVKAKYIKDLPLKEVLDGSESLLVQDLNGTQQAPLGTIVDEIKQNSQEKIREIESELAQTNVQLSKKASEQALAVERARIDSFTNLTEGSTTGDAELIDARIGVDGITYRNLGEAIRNQIDSKITPYTALPFELIPNSYINYNSGKVSILDGFYASDFIELIGNDSITIKNLNYDANNLAGLAFYNQDKVYISGYQYNKDVTVSVSVPSDAVYIRFTAKENEYLNSIVVYQNQYDFNRNVTNDVKTLRSDVVSLDESVQKLKDTVLIQGDSYYVEYHPNYLTGYYINYTNGQFRELDDSMTACDFLQLDKNADTFVIENLNYDANNLAGLAFYNQDKVYISGYQYNKDVTVSVSVPSDAVYVRFTVKTAKLSGVTSVYGKKDATVVDINTVAESVANLENKLSDLENIKETILNPVFTTGYYINYTNGQFRELDDKFAACDFLQLDKNSNILIIKSLNYNNNNLAGLAFYDKNQEYLSGYQYNHDTDVKLKVPLNAVYVRFTVNTERVNSVSVTNLTTVKDSINNLLENGVDISQGTSDLDYDYCQIFHKIAGIGDSLMSGQLAYYNESGDRTFVDCIKYSWLSNLCKNIGAEPVHYSRGGLTTKTWLEIKLSEMKAEVVLPSAYYIALGTNDAINSNVALGTVTDCGTDNATFYGYYSKIIDEVKKFNPHAKIFCCSLYFVSPSVSEDSAQKYSNAVKEMCAKYGCYYIDFLNTYGRNYKGSNTFLSVGHFTSPGYVRVGKEIQKLTNQVISENQNDFKFVGLEHKEI